MVMLVVVMRMLVHASVFHYGPPRSQGFSYLHYATHAEVGATLLPFSLHFIGNHRCKDVHHYSCGSTYEDDEWCWFSDACDKIIANYNGID
jgi:hypothetical protein